LIAPVATSQNILGTGYIGSHTAIELMAAGDDAGRRQQSATEKFS
jgi:hypothetical protein